MKRGPVVAALIIGLGLVAAPAIFQMFTRAPLGGQMIKEFGPFMTTGNIDTFQGYMDTFDRAHAETIQKGLPAAGLSAGTASQSVPQVADFAQQWPGIYSDMSGMLTQMKKDLDNFAAVDALPPFVLFPWFFVMPGLMVAVIAWMALRADKKGASSKTQLRLLAVMGVGLIAAPAIFQMFTRAPLGAEMIKDFEPLMTAEKVGTMQVYFLTIASGEGEIRTKLKPDIMARRKLDEAGFAAAFPAITQFSQDFPNISAEMAPMIGAMSDNLDNYAAVAALPPFSLFPWFFVIPGVLIIALALTAGRGATAPAPAAGQEMGAETKAVFDNIKQKADERAKQRAMTKGTSEPH